MSITEDLIGKKYPVSDQNDNIVGYRFITSAFSLGNIAGLVVGLGNSQPSLFLKYSEAEGIVNGVHQDLETEIIFKENN